MKVPDALRAQYFLGSLEKEIKNIKNKFLDHLHFSRSFSEILTEFSSVFADELDQILLPTIAYEIHNFKIVGVLNGETPKDRYVNFFVENDLYSERALHILKKYPLLFEVTDQLISQTFDSLFLCLKRYKEDEIELKKWLKLPSDIKIKNIRPLDGADRHRQQQAFVFYFSDGSKVIYKPVDLNPDLLFTEFINKLELEYPFDLRTLNTLPKDGYGWIRYIDKGLCHQLLDVENFYRRFGVLLSVADAINYTDGHCENLIADGAYPILIDGETFFQNYEQPVIERKNILTTLLIQKSNASNSFSSALQAPHGEKLEYLHTRAINDQTDEIEIRYKGINPSPLHHYPILRRTPCPSFKYIQQIKDGYCFGYRKINKSLEKIFSDQSWWTKISQTQIRTVLRETLTYLYLLRKIQQPQGMSSRSQAESILSKKLGSTPFTPYEIRDLLTLNIPYFYQLPGKRHLFDGTGYEYSNVFAETAVDRLKSQFLNRSDEKMYFNCEIISRHL